MSKKLLQLDPKIVRLNAEQKLRFRNEQVRVLSILQQATNLRAQADDLTKQAIAGEQNLQKIVDDLSAELHAPKEKYNFQVTEMEFTLKKAE
jgi:hypothetical protein